MAQPSSFRFFDLPRELRDHVYHFICLDMYPFKVPIEHRTMCVQYNPTNEPRAKTTVVEDIRPVSKSLPRWLFVSKTFFKESLAVFTENSEWTSDASLRFHSRQPSYPLFQLASAHVITVRDVGIFTTDRGQIWSADKFNKPIANAMAKSDRPMTLHLWFRRVNANRPGNGPFGCMTSEHIECFQQVNIGTLVLYEVDRFKYKTEPSERLAALRRVADVVFSGREFRIKMEKHWEALDDVRKSTNQHHWYELTKV